MKQSLLDKRWPWLTAAAAIVIAYLATIVDVSFGPDYYRPVGTADDIAQLAERDDWNLLFVLIDTLRADHLGSYGYHRDTSPTLDALASKGVRFSRHLSQSSWTKASMASLWTAMYPSRTGVTRFSDMIPEQAPTAAERLRDAGFRTAALYRNGWVAPTFGFAQGFDVYMRPGGKPLAHSIRVENPTLKSSGTDDHSVESAAEFLRLHGGQRWFLYLHFMDVHEYLYDLESALWGGAYADTYDNGIRYTDGTIRRLLERLADARLTDDTVVVIASDHGEAFRERGIEGHARRVFRESTEVPLFIQFPFELNPGVVIRTRTRNVDIWPTLLDLAGAEPFEGADGRSLVPELIAAARGAEPTDDGGVAIAHLDQNWGRTDIDPQPTVAVVDGALRYVRSFEFDKEMESLFDADRDPAELKNLSEEDPETTERLRGIADRYIESDPAWGEAPTREIDELERNHLRALGYAIP
jgi:arylsulfatase A-like enzyme